ncbi:MAG: ATP synthase protein I [Halioglobus sp.]|jgi:ATP synthase protein I
MQKANVAGAEIKRPPVYRISIIQLLILLGVSLILLALRIEWVISVLCGGLIAVLPQAYFAARTFRWRGAQSAQSIARSSYGGVVGKFIFSAAGFAVVFAMLRPVNGLAVFAAYIIMLLIQIIGSWLLLRNS